MNICQLGRSLSGMFQTGPATNSWSIDFTFMAGNEVLSNGYWQLITTVQCCGMCCIILYPVVRCTLELTDCTLTNAASPVRIFSDEHTRCFQIPFCTESAILASELNTINIINYIHQCRVTAMKQLFLHHWQYTHDYKHCNASVTIWPITKISFAVMHKVITSY